MTHLPCGSAAPEATVRCAAWAREHHVELGGTAPTCQGFLFVEWTSPWPRDASLVAELAPVHAALAETQTRLQLVRAEGHSHPAARIIWYWSDPDEPFRGYGRIEVDAPIDAVPRIAEELLRSRRPRGDARRPSETPIDLFVCGHGARDLCCGSGGTQLARASHGSSTVSGAGTRVWRTSHLGGHRFAPTAITLPDGLVWGRLDSASVESIVGRSAPAHDVTHLLRGCSALTPEGQMLDRALLAQHGWSWLDDPRVDEVVDGERVRLTATGDDASSTWEAVVGRGREMPVPDCRAPIGAAKKFERELVLAAYRSLP